MADYCWKEYQNFLKGLVSLWDEEKGRYVSHYLDGSTYKKTQKNTVQSLFPILVPGIPQKHKDSIISMLKDVPIILFRKSITVRNIRFPLFQGPTLLTTLSLPSISCGEDLLGQLQTISFLKV
jgi:hypothetical protein